MTRWLTACLALFALFGCTPNAGKNQEKPAANAKEGLKLDYAAWLIERQADIAATDAKYNDSTIALTCRLQYVAGKRSIWVGGEKEGGATEEILCQLRPEFADKALRLTIGQKIKVTGKYRKGMHGTLEDCDLAELEPSKVPVTTAEDLVRDCETGKAGVRYRANDNIIVTGAFERTAKIDPKTKGGGLYVKLKGTEKTGVSILIPPIELEAFSQLKKGTHVEMRALFSSAKLEKNELRLEGGALIRAK